MEDQTEVEVKPETGAQRAARLMNRTVIATFMVAVMSEDWLTWELSKQQEFRKDFHGFWKAVETVRSNFDKQIWEGWATGKFTREELPSIRNERTGDKPGRKAVVLTAEEKLAKSLGWDKEDSEDDTE